MIIVKFEVSRELQAGFKNAPRKLRLAQQRALNTGAKQARTVANKFIRSRRNVRAKDVSSRLTLNKATRSKLTAEVKISSTPIPYLLKPPPDAPGYLGTRIVTGRGRRRKGASRSRSPVEVQPIKGQRKILKHAFVDLRTGRVLSRVGRRRYPTKLLFGPSLTSAFRDARNVQAMKAKARQVVPRETERQARLLFKGALR